MLENPEQQFQQLGAEIIGLKKELEETRKSTTQYLQNVPTSSPLR